MVEQAPSTSQQHDLIRSMGLIASALKHVRLNDAELFQPLMLLCDCLSLNAAAFFLITTDGDKSFELCRLGHWEAEKQAGSLILDSKSIPENVFSALQRGEIRFHKDTSLGQDLMLLPITKCDQLSAIIALGGLTRARFNSEIQIF